MSWNLTHLNIKGVKGVLDHSGDFNLGDGKSIAIFAPNGCGKSGYADAVEYLVSKDGSVEHLGQGDADSERGGKQALLHVLAEEKGITSTISATFHRINPTKTVNISREVKTGRIDPMPQELKAIIDIAPAHRILRQHDLRQFVVDMPPRDKYTELSRWLGLEYLEIVLSHLTTTKNELANTDPNREFNERLQDVVKHTKGEIKEYKLLEIFTWCTKEIQKHLPEQSPIGSIEEINTSIDSLRRRRDQLIVQSGNVYQRHKEKQQLEEVSRLSTSLESPITSFIEATKRVALSEKQVSLAFSTAKNSIFQETWETSKKVLDSNKVDVCPICGTEWAKTTASSQTEALVQIVQNLDSLSKLKEAQDSQKENLNRLGIASKSLESLLKRLQSIAEKLSLPQLAKKALELVEIIETLPRDNIDAPKNEALVVQCNKLFIDDVNAAIIGVQIENLPVSADAVDQTANQIIGLKEALDRLRVLESERSEYRKIQMSFETISTLIQQQSANLVNGVVQVLRDDVEKIYLKIHPTSAVPNIYITPDAGNKTLSLRVGFHSTGRTVPPGGYLSESQINTLGLSLFFSCVRLFNKEFPFIFLDDIVSSYDADHRARIVDVIAEDLGDFQVFLTTHDERFYSMLKSRLIDKGWLFNRITGWTLEEGPERENDSPKSEAIEQLIRTGNFGIAGNAVRRFMEEWLDEICAKYDVYTIHKRGEKEFERTLFDYWDPFIKRLKEIRGSFFGKRIEKQPCYERLKSHSLINYYSHAQTNPYTWGSMGDVQYVWVEFKEFQKLFLCFSCSRVLKYDGDVGRLYCVCGSDIFPH
jgi:hypothetical protein